jgi:signal transduction histidine kinase
MIVIKQLENRLIVIILSFITITIIGIFDYLTAAELTLSIFYLIPISLHALYKGTTKTTVIINAIFAALVWTIVSLLNELYSSNFYALWNAFIMFAFFLITGLLLFSLKVRIKKIHEMNEYLSQINEEKNKFIGIAAHDLRSSIGIINSFSDLLLSDHSKNMSPDISRIITYIKEMSKSTLIMLKNLLNISLIESGKIKLTVKNQNYLIFIEQNIQLTQIIADKKEIIIKLETSDAEINLNFDEHYLSEVINNLLSNAIKFSNRNSQIIIKVSKTESNCVLTEVIDHGNGIPQEEQIKLFEYFQTTSTRPTAGERSTGLGLAITKKIVTEHNGFIGVKSDVGIGSNFYYKLPV